MKGLNDEEVKERQEKYGLNALTPPPPKSAFLEYMKKVAGLFNLLLIFAGILAICLYFLDTSAIVNVLCRVDSSFYHNNLLLDRSISVLFLFAWLLSMLESNFTKSIKLRPFLNRSR